MKICIISSGKLSYESGSTLYAINIAEKMLNKGHEIHIICQKKPLGKKDIYFYEVDTIEHPVIDDYYIDSSRMFMAIKSIVEKVLELYDKGIVFDIIHAHYATINAVAAMIINILLNIPFVISCFGRDIFNGSKNDERYFKMQYYSLMAANYTICSNNAIWEKLMTYDSSLWKRASILKMPIQMEMKDTKKTSDIITIISIVSCMAKEKGIDITLEAFAKIIKKNRVKVKLEIIGQDEHPERRNKRVLEEKTRNLGIEKYVNFVGAVKHENIYKFLVNADILIDSRLEGNYSSVVLEGLIAKKVVIATDVRGNKEFIKDYYNGYLYKAGDSDELAEKIEYCMQNRKEMERIVDNIKQWILKTGHEFDLDIHVENLLEIYQKSMNLNRFEDDG